MRKPHTILVVDDDPDVVRAARMTLAPHIPNIESTDDPARIEPILTSHEFDAVLLDMSFVDGVRSGREGLNALTQIRELDLDLSVILTTAYGGVMLAVQSMKMGAVDFVLKPWRDEKLIDSVLSSCAMTRTKRKFESLDLDNAEKDTIERALTRHRGNVSMAAVALGLSRGALYRRMSKHGLECAGASREPTGRASVPHEPSNSTDTPEVPPAPPLTSPAH